MGIHAVAQPYANFKHNIIDGLLFLNLAVINGLSAYTVFKKVEDKKMHGNQHRIKPPLYTVYIQILLIYLPIIVVLAILVKQFCCKILTKTSKTTGTEGVLPYIPEYPQADRELLISAKSEEHLISKSQDLTSLNHCHLTY